MRGAAAAADSQRPGGLAADDHGLVAVAVSAARLRSTGTSHSRQTAGRGRRRVRHSSSVTSRRRAPQTSPVGLASSRATPARAPPRPSCRRCRGRTGGRRRGAAARASRARSPCRRGRAAASGRDPVPRDRRHQVGGAAGVEHGTRWTSACSGSSAMHRAIASSAPPTSPDGEEIATSASSSARSPLGDPRGAGLDQRVHAPSAQTDLGQTCPRRSATVVRRSRAARAASRVRASLTGVPRRAAGPSSDDLAVQVVGLDGAGAAAADSASVDEPARCSRRTPIRSQRPDTSVTSSAS